MFTIQQIQNVAAKIKSGTDFPEFIQDIKTLGVIAYTVMVHNGQATYMGEKAFTINSQANNSVVEISTISNKEVFPVYLKAHQQGFTTYAEFCKHCAEMGVQKWVVDIAEMTCTYFDMEGNIVLEEKIMKV